MVTFFTLCYYQIIPLKCREKCDFSFSHTCLRKNYAFQFLIFIYYFYIKVTKWTWFIRRSDRKIWLVRYISSYCYLIRYQLSLILIEIVLNRYTLTLMKIQIRCESKNTCVFHLLPYAGMLLCSHFFRTKNLIGPVKYATFVDSVGFSKGLFVATEENVVASLSVDTGIFIVFNTRWNYTKTSDLDGTSHQWNMRVCLPPCYARWHCTKTSGVRSVKVFPTMLPICYRSVEFKLPRSRLSDITLTDQQQIRNI